MEDAIPMEFTSPAPSKTTEPDGLVIRSTGSLSDAAADHAFVLAANGIHEVEIP